MRMCVGMPSLCPPGAHGLFVAPRLSQPLSLKQAGPGWTTGHWVGSGGSWQWPRHLGWVGAQSKAPLGLPSRWGLGQL